MPRAGAAGNIGRCGRPLLNTHAGLLAGTDARTLCLMMPLRKLTEEARAAVTSGDARAKKLAADRAFDTSALLGSRGQHRESVLVQIVAGELRQCQESGRVTERSRERILDACARLDAMPPSKPALPSRRSPGSGVRRRVRAEERDEPIDELLDRVFKVS